MQGFKVSPAIKIISQFPRTFLVDSILSVNKSHGRAKIAWLWVPVHAGQIAVYVMHRRGARCPRCACVASRGAINLGRHGWPHLVTTAVIRWHPEIKNKSIKRYKHSAWEKKKCCSFARKAEHSCSDSKETTTLSMLHSFIRVTRAQVNMTRSHLMTTNTRCRNASEPFAPCLISETWD